MKIKVYGAKAFWCQAPRIIEGINGIGHVVVDGGQDFTFANNPPYDIGDEEYKDSTPESEEGFKIFNVLDVPEHVQGFDLDRLEASLQKADAVTCISPPVKEQLERLIGIDATVIWNPIKDISCDLLQPRTIQYLYVGRANDPNKRYDLLKSLDSESIMVVGSDKPKFGKYLGQQSDNLLNSIYNSVKFVLLPSKFEGLGLPMLEGMAAGCIPIVCNDNPNSNLCPDFCRCDPDPEAIRDRVNEINKDYKGYRNHILQNYTFKTQKRFSKFSIARNIINVYRNKKGMNFE